MLQPIIKGAIISFLCLLLASGVTPQRHTAVSHRELAPSFQLPVPPGVDVTVTQGNDMPAPDWDHNGKARYAFDFIIAQDHFPVTATQAGIVLGVDDSSTTHCDKLDHEMGAASTTPLLNCWTHANYILIADVDGQTAALYLHLLPHSALVHTGDPVLAGQQLALAGSTGFSTGTHLHFQVEAIPSQSAQVAQNAGWWWTQSVPVAFTDADVHALNGNGVPKTGQQLCWSSPKCGPVASSAVVPGGVWASPANGAAVGDVLHFAAHAYPTHAGDPSLDRVNFTVKSQGGWQVACTVVPPSNDDLFTCDANLAQLGVHAGTILVSFDVYDRAGHVNAAPNGVHTLTYAPGT